MRRNFKIEHEFVDFIPKEMDEHTLYVSMEFATVSHLCFCGCGSEVVTPLSPVGWQLSFDGEAISLSPSVGSWSLPCQSHYIIKGGRVLWAGTKSKEQIAAVRHRDQRDINRHFGVAQETAEKPAMLDHDPPATMPLAPADSAVRQPSLLKRFIRWISG
jgi:hypothetical protein